MAAAGGVRPVVPWRCCGVSEESLAIRRLACGSRLTITRFFWLGPTRKIIDHVMALSDGQAARLLSLTQAAI